jgi:hypothetical protein
VIQDKLNQAGLPRRVEVLNFGVPSWGTDQKYIALREYGLIYRPDLVLLAFYAQNDVFDNSAKLHSKRSAYTKPFFAIQDGRLIEVPFVDRTPNIIYYSRRLAAPFRLYPLVRDSLIEIPVAHRLLYKLGIVGVVPQEINETAPPSATPLVWPARWRHQLGVYSSDYYEDWKEAWAITEGLLARINNRAKRADADLLLVQTADPISVMPSALLASLVANAKVDGLDTGRPSRLLKQLARRHDINYMSMIPAFRTKIADREKEFAELYLQCDGHWTSAGHRLAAELVVPTVVRKLEASSKRDAHKSPTTSRPQSCSIPLRVQ